MKARFSLDHAAIIAAALLGMLVLSRASVGQAVVPAAPLQPSTTVTLTAAADATLKSWLPNTNFGSDPTVYLSHSHIETDENAVMLVRFDLSGIPSDAIIDSASLQLYLESSSGLDPVDLNVYYVRDPWTESTVTWNTMPRVFLFGVAWQMDAASGWKSLGIAGWVSSWLTGENDGLLLYGPSTGVANYYRAFPSWERGWNPPSLVVTYHLPPTVLSGNVYSGTIGYTSQPLGDVQVGLYCSSGANVQGALLVLTTTTSLGKYEMTTNDICEFYNVIETDPAGYYSVGATTVSGTIRSANWIQYGYSQRGRTLTGDVFWDHAQTLTDTLPPGNWANFLPTQWVTVQTVQASEQVEDTFSGLDVSTAQYAYSVNGGDSWSSWTAASVTGSDGATTPQTLSALIPFGQDSGPMSQNWVKFRIADMAGNLGESPTHTVKIDSVPPQNPTSLSSSSHTPGVWSTFTQVAVQWSGAWDDRSGLYGYSINWDHSPTTVPDVYRDTADTTLTNNAFVDAGDWWFHVRSLDQAGNAAVGAKHLGPFKIDTAPPTAWLTAPPSGAVGARTFDVSWTGQDATSSVASFDVQTSADGTTWNDWHMGVTYQTAYFTGERTQTYYFRVRARDQAGNVGDWSSQVQVSLGVDVTVRVENENGTPLVGANVYLNGIGQGPTYSGGVRTLHNVLVGDQLAARYLIEQRLSSKPYHNWFYGPNNWAYHIYITSVNFDNVGNPQLFAVSNTGVPQVLVVRKQNPLIGFNILVSVEWDADSAFLTQLSNGFQNSSAYLFDVTDGQMYLEAVDIWDNKERWDQADYLIQAINGYRANASVAGLWKGQDKHAYFGRGIAWDKVPEFRTVIHEFGHYGLDLLDEYIDSHGVENATQCTIDRHSDPNLPQDDQASFMDDQGFTTEMCSSLPLHPHNTNTMQHAQRGGPCWDTVVDRYKDTQNPPRWILERPNDRGSIMPGPTAIPVPDWSVKRVIGMDSNACAPFETAWVYQNGSPALDFDTWVEGSHHIYQGKTIPDTPSGVPPTAGVITILGAYNGDTVRVHKDCGWFCSYSGSTTASCPSAAAPGEQGVAAPTLPQGILEPDPFTLEITSQVLEDGNTLEIAVLSSAALPAAPQAAVIQEGSTVLTPTLSFDGLKYTGSVHLDPALNLRGQIIAQAADAQARSVHALAFFKAQRLEVGQLTWLISEDGLMEVYLPAGSLAGDPVVNVSSASQVSLTQGNLVVVQGPYEVSLSTGQSALSQTAAVNIYFQPEMVTGLISDTLRIYHWDAQTRQWINDGGTIDYEHNFVSTQVKRLSTFAVLAEKAMFPIYLPIVLR